MKNQIGLLFKDGLLIALILLSNSIFSQNVKWDSLILLIEKSNPSYLELEKMANVERMKKYQLGEVYIRSDGKTLINPGHWHKSYEIYKYIKKRQSQKYQLIIYQDSTRILYSRIMGSNGDKIISEKEYDGFAETLKKHEMEWGFKPSGNHNINFPKEIPLVGIACGYSGGPTMNFLKIKKRVEAGERAEILEMCKSLSPGIRCLGGIGLKYFEIRGDKLNNEEKELLNKISIDQSPVRSCYGCTNWGFYSSVQELYSNGILIIEHINW